ncbi:DEAD/DEAH box helicase [Halobacteriovorax sp.]|uniref:DEAD/DEAH box helicase n=1 Tax=Halobacteriovorax sp. TaxID=2020862 RepID=UPI0035664981
MNFTDFTLPESLLRALEDKGYKTPTDIQEKAIPLLLEKHTDFVGQAQTGTGKTAAFSLPLLAKIDRNCGDVQAIVLSPTRELANQITEEMRSFCKHDTIKLLSVYGGVPLDGQIRTLKRGRPQVVVGTPGRVLDLIKRGVLKLENAKLAVLDEADEMLDMGFIDDVKTILSELGDKKKTWMYSATMPKQILNLIQTYLDNPEIIKIAKKTLSNEDIEQKYFLIKRGNLGEAVCRILDSLSDYYGIVFCRTKVDAKKLSDEFNFRGFPSDALHGDMSQMQRDLTMRAFKKKKVKLLVCTDVAARGIDVDNLTHVINYGLPQDLESYVHRIGRTGRAGQKGSAYTIIDSSEKFRIRMLERLMNTKIEQGKLPTVEQIKNALVKNEVVKLEEVSNKLAESENVDSSFSVFEESLKDMDKDALVKVMFNYMFKENMDRYSKKSSIEMVPGERPERGDRNSRNPRERSARGDRPERGPRAARGASGYARFYVGVGKKHGVDLKEFLSSVSGATGVEEREIRRVDLKDQFSFFEVSDKYKEKVLLVAKVSAGGHTGVLEATKAGPAPRRDSRGGGPRRDSRGGNRRSDPSSRRNSFRSSSNGEDGAKRSYNRD